MNDLCVLYSLHLEVILIVAVTLKQNLNYLLLREKEFTNRLRK